VDTSTTCTGIVRRFGSTLFSFFAGPVFAAAAFAQGGGHVAWTHSSGAENWIPKTVALGNDTQNVFFQFDGYLGSARLFSTQAPNPPSPLWTDNAAYMSFSSEVAAADDADVLATLRFDQPSSTAQKVPVVARYASNSSTPRWTYSFPFTVNNPTSGIQVSRDGQTIAAWVYDYSNLKTAVAVFGPTSGTPRSYSLLYTAGMPNTAKLSDDGSTLLIVSDLKQLVFKTATGTLALDGWNMTSIGNGVAISRDGSTYAITRQRQYVDVFKNNALSFTLDLGLPEPACHVVEFNDSGTTLALGWNFGAPNLETRVQVVDVGSPSHPVVLNDSIIGVGANRMNIITDMDLSADGSLLAVGTSGDADNVAPGIVLYQRAPTWSRLYEQDLPGSVNAVDVSADGQYIAVASKAVHMNVAGSGGRIDLFRAVPAGGPSADLEVFGSTHLGDTITFRAYVLPGQFVRLLRAPSLAATPQIFPGVGTLYLDRPKTKLAATGFANANGVFETSLVIPMDASLVGRTFYFQGYGMTPDALGQDYVSVTVLP
jgi:hypothetical protein